MPEPSSARVIEHPTLGQVVATMEELYPPALAEGWDAVGLVCGDPEAVVRRVLFAVDPAAVVADEAVERGADLVVCHHPLFLKPVHGVPATTPKGRLVHQLVQHGVGLFTAHTNADSARDGVSDALAEAVGLVETVPLRPLPSGPVDKLVVFVPPEHADALMDALSAAGAGAIGDYRRCAYLVDGTGTFLPGPGAQPTVGTVGRVERTTETRVEMVLPRAHRAAVVDALRASHPYEEPAFDLIETAALPSGAGLGRVGRLPEPITLRELARRVAAALPATAVGLRVAGDPDGLVSCVAVCGGAGDSLLADATAAGADAFVTADLRHHPAGEHLAAGGPWLVDPGHWASEWPWLAWAAGRLRHELAAHGTTVETLVSTQCTDPWSLHVPFPEESP